MRNSRRSPKKANLPAPFELEIDRYSHDGRGIGIHQGRVVMVSNAMPGEQVQVKLEQANTKLWQGKAVKHFTQSDRRQQPTCQYYGECGGCVLQHVPVSDQVALKQSALEDHLRRNKVPHDALAEPISIEKVAYRHRARFQVSKKGEVGFFNVKGNRIVPISQCAVVVPSINDALNIVKREAPLEGVKQLELVIDDTDQLGISVVEGSGASKSALAQWGEKQGWVSQAPLQYRSAGAQTWAKPGSFTQVNRRVNTAMIEQAKAWLDLDASDRVLDLFCGNGNVSLPFAKNVEAILGLEANQEAIDMAMNSEQANQQTRYCVANLFTSPLKDIPEIAQFNPTAVILDPPRAGAEAVVKNMNTLPTVQKILYISCDPATLARDIAELIHDKWHLRKVGVMDMFPHTRHIESMALLEKKKK
ncbi:methyltransferase [Reinekea forsetii]|nr:methyltransferase [Reinekea forsetii]